MNKKQNIQIAVIVLFFGLAGFVLYKGGLFGTNLPSAPQAPQTAAAGSQAVLPYGNTPLDVSLKSVIDSNRFQYNIVQYPQVNAQVDVGISEVNLIVSQTPP